MRISALLGAGGILLGLLLLTGCGDDHPYRGATPRPMRHEQGARAANSTTLPVPAAAAPTDPLIGTSQQPLTDPLIGRDPLQGRAMPTVHSHWLRGRLHNAHMTVLLNRVRYKSFPGTIDQDITMLLHSGANTVTFVFQPNSPGSSADMEILESEHDPPIPPLVTFQTTGTVESGRPAPMTKTFPFIAR